ncbi:hypothetical protein [Rhodococcus sp. 14-1411-2a]|uniref:hypothetical protein n=1 Tax=Rhodococcus sp. 14-1411-2a TaxID=2023151 RepID=UPI0015C5BD6D|nr:hypothetical protein [Rhodococcus sp. 14-1411-2a]
MTIEVQTTWNGHRYTWTLQPDGWWDLTHRTSAPTVKRRLRAREFGEDHCELVTYD